MKNIISKSFIIILCIAILAVGGCTSTSNNEAIAQETEETVLSNQSDNTNSDEPNKQRDEKPKNNDDTNQDNKDEKPPRPDENKDNKNSEKPDENNKINESNEQKYSMEQATSDRGQLSTIAFSGLAFITGSAGADSFLPPGKVADFFGFQYMRDNDQNGLGHNTTFLTIAATNVLNVLDNEQQAKLVELATSQETLFEEYALARFPMMTSFRDYLEGDYTDGTTLDKEMVAEYSSSLYEIDAQLSYERALVMGEIISSFTDEQVAYFEELDFYDSSTWPVIENGEDIIDKKSLSHTEHVAVMTYASEMFSWYLGNVDADAYFCPERHGTYFGGFYMKDYHAMGNPDYFISTTVTGDSGEEFLNILTDEQRMYVTGLIDEQSDNLDRIVEIRYEVSNELRKSINSEEIDKEKVYKLIKEYGYLEGEMSYMYANAFAKVNETLSEDQLDKMYVLRNLDIYPDGAFLFSAPIDMPQVDTSKLLFK